MRTLILASVSAIALSLSGVAFAAGNMSNSSEQQSMGGKADRQQIMQVQQKLKSEGLYQGQVDGVDGPQTQAALKQYQQKNGLEQTGQLDEQTEAKLGISENSGSSMSGSSTPSSGNTMSSPSSSSPSSQPQSGTQR